MQKGDHHKIVHNRERRGRGPAEHGAAPLMLHALKIIVTKPRMRNLDSHISLTSFPVIPFQTHYDPRASIHKPKIQAFICVCVSLYLYHHTEKLNRERSPNGSLAAHPKALTGCSVSADFAVDDDSSSCNRKCGEDDSPLLHLIANNTPVPAAWFRPKFPRTSRGALASSAPILYFDDITPQNGYHLIVTKDFRVGNQKDKDTSESCCNTVRQSWLEIGKVAAEPNGLMNPSQIFKTCNLRTHLNSSRTTWPFYRSVRHR